MRVAGILSLLIACVISSGCASPLESQQAPPKWTTGFWFWPGSAADVLLHSGTPDVIFFHAGDITHEGTFVGAGWNAYGSIPEHLPEAREYWGVFRFDRQQVPDQEVAGLIAAQVVTMLDDARGRGINLAGVQLDIDSPTNSLRQYAAFIHELRKGLPKGVQISITALLDWFRDGTSVGDVIREVDEFVPQFYDVSYDSMMGGAIAAKFDGAHWGPVLNRQGKRFRVGISSFGRSRMIPAPRSQPTGSPRNSGLAVYGDLSPLDIARNPAFGLETARDQAGEVVLNYRAVRKVRIGWQDLGTGDVIQFVLPAPEEIRAAVEGARHMGGNCAGVVFFRWPADNESLTLQPDEVMAAAGGGGATKHAAEIQRIDGMCAAVKCMDLYLVGGAVLSPQPTRYLIHASTDMEYFIPDEKTPARMTGPRELELSLPPYCGRNRMLLGRAVMAREANFTVEEEP